MIPEGNVIGVGIDAVDVERFRAILGRRRTFAERVFTAAERAEAAARHDPVPGLAARFAAKEAVMKSLSVGLGAFDFADVEVVRGEGGAPALSVTGRAATASSENTTAVSSMNTESGWSLPDGS